ncbi:MAG TPA: Crp/Fnr family transcriptional regulator [Pyrinomonadaceae bacterium]|nr:Crp/Fnr family transcriptional regulator [Pyrinomonadaceae bacterium]
MTKPHTIDNLILAALPREEFESLLPHLESVSLPVGEILYNSGDAVEYVYFPGTALISLVTHINDGLSIEVGIIGKDGMVGIPVLLGDDIAFEEALVQIAGSATRMRSNVLKEKLTQTHSPLLTLLLLYTRTLMKQVIQTAVCNRLHSEKERLSRWLLMSRDRVESNELPLTQHYVSDVLGLGRESVSNAALSLQAEGLISYSAGRISILNREKLEQVACECYRVVALNAERVATSI